MPIESEKTPGVYIAETNAFPNSVVQVATAIPAFIGYTPQAEYNGKSYLFKPTLITSMTDFQAFFAYPQQSESKVAPKQIVPSYYLTPQKKKQAKGESYVFHGQRHTIEPDPATIYYLYNSVQLFFQNGGSQAYIVSIGTYGPPSNRPTVPGEDLVNPNVHLADIQKGLKELEKVPDVTIYVVPEGVLLSRAENGTMMEEMLLQCHTMKTAISIFDVIGAREPDPLLWENDITQFRNHTGIDFLKYGTAYYPDLVTTVVPFEEVDYTNINGGEVEVLRGILSPPQAPNPKAEAILQAIEKGNDQTVEGNNQALLNASPVYKQLLKSIQEKMNTMPPSGIMAGVYSLVDANYGVWKAPANISPIGVSDLTIKISNAEQENLNVDAQTGKSVNAIRYFPGQGILVWGARTLDGNSQDWRYIPVVRTVIMIVQSVKLAMRAYVFEPNDANTWSGIKSMAENFLTNVWKEGGLRGASAADAFKVEIGLGATMTAQDIEDGTLRLTLFLAITHPAEFIVETMEQQQAT